VRALAIVLMWTATVRADPSADAEIQLGTELAGKGQFKEAIERFKEARKVAPDHAEPDCLIALAYRRLEHRAQARLFLGRCMKSAWRPAWLDQLVADLDNATTHLTEVTFAVTPPTARIELASFAPDETFAPQPTFLEYGQQLVTVSAPGFASERRAIDVPSGGPYEVRIELHPVTEPSPPTGSTSSPSPSAKRSHTGKYLVIASAGVVAVGVATHIIAYVQRSDLTTGVTAYKDGLGTFHAERDVAIGAYALGAIGLAVGGWLWHREVGPVVEPHAVGVAWRASW
jgi:hypothetical protein